MEEATPLLDEFMLRQPKEPQRHFEVTIYSIGCTSPTGYAGPV
jgi:hypothetical protein